jgi:hypothetical protein
VYALLEQASVRSFALRFSLEQGNRIFLLPIVGKISEKRLSSHPFLN